MINYTMFGQKVTLPYCQRRLADEMVEDGRMTPKQYWDELRRTYSLMDDWAKTEELRILNIN